jgi:hypothetical protein
MPSKFTAKREAAPQWKRAAMSHPDVPGAGAKKRKKLHGAKKIDVAMSEFKRGTLRSGSGAKVRKYKQAVKIALSEARRSQ